MSVDAADARPAGKSVSRTASARAKPPPAGPSPAAVPETPDAPAVVLEAAALPVPIEPLAPVAPSANERKAMDVVRNRLGWASAAGLIPMPGLDLVAIVGVQVSMLHEIGAIYGRPLPKQGLKPLVLALIGGGGSYMLAAPTTSLVKAIPGVGMLAGMLTLPALAAASCYATGKVFIQHFESGGTFLDFESGKVRSYYARQFEAGKAITAS
jgi:uncharacterized protein (DUF697 family)